MTNDEVVKLVEEAFNAWTGHPNANAGDEKRASEALGVIKAALTALPDDVARDVEKVRKALQRIPTQEWTADTGEHALSRLATAAARVPGLERDLRAMTEAKERAVEAYKQAEQQRFAAVTERDEALRERNDAQQEVEKLKKRDANWRTHADTVEQERDEAEARATAAEAKMNDVEMLLNTNERTRAYHHLPLRERVAALLDAPTPAPGLREAVGRIVDGDSTPDEDVRYVMVPVGEWNDLCAAYDAAPSTPEPSVTHADLAAVAREVADEDNTGREPEGSAMAEAHSDGWTTGALEVVRRATGGQVPEVLLKACVVEVLARRLTEARTGEQRARELDSTRMRMHHAGGRDMATAIAQDLSLTLPTGPGGGERVPPVPVTPEAKAKAQEAIASLRARTGGNPPESPDGSESRHPRVTPEGPALAQPEPAAPEVAWEGDGVRVLADGWWTHDGRHTHNVSVAGVLARALAEARRESRHLGNICKRVEEALGPGVGTAWERIETLKQEGDWARQNTRDVDRDRCDTINTLTREGLRERLAAKDAARKAAEDMRERAASVVSVLCGFYAGETLRLLVAIESDIRALPLEAK